MFNSCASCCVCTPPKSNFAFVANFPAALPANTSHCDCCCAGPEFSPYGNCNGCSVCGHGDVLNSKLACEIPWLKPMPIACGEQESIYVEWGFPLDPNELDGNTDATKRLPGRYPWTVQCVKVCGEASAYFDNTHTTTPPAEAYTIYLCIRVPVELVVSDACGYTYCLHSYYTQLVKIELCRRAGMLGEDIQAYIKVNVRLSAPISIPDQNQPLTVDPANVYCDGNTPSPAHTHWLPKTTIHSEISVCLTKMVPYGVICG